MAGMVMNELELRLLATTDSLTGVLSRRAFSDAAARGVALAQRHSHDLSCIVWDLDHFRSINDCYGHATGDIVLSKAVSACMGQLRETDLVGRMGGEEFAAVLPFTTRDAALEVAEKLRIAVQRVNFVFGEQITAVTASFGVASLDQSTNDVDTLLRHADAALYQAKRSGRNGCSTWEVDKTIKQPDWMHQVK
jgi:diguanylate cyclase (GGDEF)-like protein